MKKYFFITVLIVFAFNCKKMELQYPEAKTVDSVDNFFGTEVPDPYKWMENENDPDLKKWIDEENSLTQSYLSRIPYRQKIYDWLKNVYNYEKMSVLYKRGGLYLFYKNNGLQNQSVLYYKKSLTDSAKILLDPNKLSDDGTIALAATAISKNGKYFAYAIARSGSDWNEIFVKDIETGKMLPDHIKWVKFSSIAWYKDGFFYSRYDEPVEGKELTNANLNQKVYYHKVGTDQSQDIMIYSDAEHPTHGFGAQVSDDEKYLIISEWAGTSGTILHFKNLEKNTDFVKLNDNFDYDFSFVDDLNGNLLIMTNFNAENYKIIAVNPDNPNRNNWVDFIAESTDVLTGISISKNYIFVEYNHDVKSILKLYDHNGSYIRDIELPGIGSVNSISSNKDDDIVFYKFSSYNVPGTIYRYNPEKDETQIYYKTPFKGVDLDNIVVEQKFYKSFDGTEIPMFLVHKKGIEKNGKNPVWLYGYGGFNISLTPGFDVRRMLWIENGGIYVVANIRGGGEYGEKWHKAGTKLQKKNVFRDFIAAAEFLINEKYTSSQYLTIEGGSNGGLLIGAVVNIRPELFKVALPHVGVMDMLHYYKFTIGWAWASDYGLPTESKQMFEYIYSYSPYHNIKCGKDRVYPAILVMTADHDDRVVPAHSFKYIARLQSTCKNNPNPLLIRIETKAGHGAGKPTEKILEELTDVYAFTFYNLGVKPNFN